MRHLTKLTIRGNSMFWYWENQGSLNQAALLQEAQDPPILLARLEELVFLGVIYTNAFLQGVTTPSLMILGMTKHTTSPLEDWETASDISALLERSKCALQQLI
jgi:hypothetical protein